MNDRIDRTLESWLARGVNRIGEIVIHGQFELVHFADAGRTDLESHDQVEAAREIAKYDDAGEYRPLKTAPNLRHGWKLTLRNAGEVRVALDFFYPAMLGTLCAYGCEKLTPVNLRETLARQSGMYAVTKKITNAQADQLTGEFCRSDQKCLKTILWKIDPHVPVTSLPAMKFDPAATQLQDNAPAIPLLCAEACNLLVAAARKVVRPHED